MAVFITGNTRIIEITKSGIPYLIQKSTAIVYTSGNDVGIVYYVGGGYSPTQEIITFPYTEVANQVFASPIEVADYIKTLADDDQSFTNSAMVFSGITATGDTISLIKNLSATTFSSGTVNSNIILSGGTDLVDIFAPIGGVGGGGGATNDNGLNTYTGGTSAFQKINISAATLHNLVVTGSSTNYLSNISANTISGATYYGDGNRLTGITGSFGITIDGGGSVITTGQKTFLTIYEDRIITGWFITADLPGVCVIDVWKEFGSLPLNDGYSIAGSDKPTINNSEYNSNEELTSWDINLYSGDVILFNVDSVSTVTKVNLVIKTIKK